MPLAPCSYNNRSTGRSPLVRREKSPCEESARSLETRRSPVVSTDFTLLGRPTFGLQSPQPAVELAQTSGTMATLQNQPIETPGVDAATHAAGAPHAATPREQFIPLRRAALVETLAGLSPQSGGAAEGFRRLCRVLQAVLHGEYLPKLEELKEAYAAFDPDLDTRAVVGLSDAERDERRQKLFDQFNWLLERGNFTRLTREHIEHSLSDASHWGLNLTVDFELFERLEVYSRGDTIGTRFRRRLRNRFKIEAVDVPIYERLVLIFRFRPGRRFSKLLDTDDVYIKLFKEIPKLDLDMLLPETRVRMSLVDRAKIMFPTLSGMSLAAIKIILAWGSTLAMWGLIGGTLGYGVRSVYGYLNTKQKYQLNLTQSLYYQNIDNNAGVLHRILDEAEEQESRETILAYYFLWTSHAPEGLTADELDRQIEAFLRTEAAREVDFEIVDALAKLERFGIVERGPGDKWKAVEIDRALEALRRFWGGLLS